jgi:hypothetical protein
VHLALPEQLPPPLLRRQPRSIRRRSCLPEERGRHDESDQARPRRRHGQSTGKNGEEKQAGEGAGKGKANGRKGPLVLSRLVLSLTYAALFNHYQPCHAYWLIRRLD